MTDPNSLERVRGSAVPVGDQVSDADLWHQWLDRVRGRVGTAVRVPWWIVRQWTGIDLRGWYDAGRTPAQAAQLVVEAWIDWQNKTFEAPLC